METMIAIAAAFGGVIGLAVGYVLGLRIGYLTGLKAAARFKVADVLKRRR